MPRQYIRRSETDRLLEKATRTSEPAACWEWQAALFTNGYGAFRVGNRQCKAHRVSYELVNGPIPEGLVIYHTCGNRRCINPSHLRAGTQLENRQDDKAGGRTATGDRNGSITHPERLKRGDENGAHLHPERLARGNTSGRRLHPEHYPTGDQHPAHLHPELFPRGEKVNTAVLTEERVREIRALYATGDYTQTALGHRFGVTQHSIWAIVHGKNWKHVV